MDQRRQTGGENDTAELPPIPAQRVATVAEPDLLQPGKHGAAIGAADEGRELITGALQQRLVKAGDRLINHARDYWLLLA